MDKFQDELFNAWDKLDRATQAILTSQPWQMTERARLLEEARQGMDSVMHKFARQR